MSYDTHCSSCGMPYSDFAREGAKSCECHKMAAQAVRDFVFDKPALSAAPVAQGNQLLTLLDDATVILQGLIEHPDDKDSWDEANKLLPKLLSRLERQGDECCAHGVELHQDCYRCDEGSPAPVAQEPVAWQFLTRAGKWVDCEKPDPEDFNKMGVRFRGLYTSPPATPAGVGADDIARAVCDAMSNGNIQLDEAGPTLRADCFETARAILALLSRAGDQSNSTHEEQSTQNI